MSELMDNTDRADIAAIAGDRRAAVAEPKCIACNGEGELSLFDVHGEQCGVATCPTCGGTRYAS